MPSLSPTGATCAVAVCTAFVCVLPAAAFENDTPTQPVVGAEAPPPPVTGVGVARRDWNAPATGWWAAGETPSFNLEPNGRPPSVFRGAAMAGRRLTLLDIGGLTWTMNPSLRIDGATGAADGSSAAGIGAALDQEIVFLPLPGLRLSLGTTLGDHLAGTAAAASPGAAAPALTMRGQARIGLDLDSSLGAPLKIELGAATAHLGEFASDPAEAVSCELQAEFAPKSRMPLRISAPCPGTSEALHLRFGVQARF